MIAKPVKNPIDLTKMAVKEQVKATDSAESDAPRVDTVAVPRGIIYFQGALLGVVATTFFVFGMMVGSVTTPGARSIAKECRVYGSVVFGDRIPDEGAVVMLLPTDERPDVRFDAKLLNPDSFVPLENKAIDFIHNAGGAVVRVDSRGEFEVVVDSPGDYFLLVISKNQNADASGITKSQMANIGSYFVPVDGLIDESEFHWELVKFSTDSREISQIKF